MQLTEQHCTPIPKGSPPLGRDEIVRYLGELGPRWRVTEQGMLHADFTFADFMEAMAFVVRVALIAEKEQHHPDVHIAYNRVVIDLTTHDIGGLSLNDCIVAAHIETLGSRAVV